MVGWYEAAKADEVGLARLPKKKRNSASAPPMVATQARAKVQESQNKAAQISEQTHAPRHPHTITLAATDAQIRVRVFEFLSPGFLFAQSLSETEATTAACRPRGQKQAAHKKCKQKHLGKQTSR